MKIDGTYLEGEMEFRDEGIVSYLEHIPLKVHVGYFIHAQYLLFVHLLESIEFASYLN